MAMTAHIVYDAIDHDYPATTSKKAINLIREDFGFDGLLMTDDLSMKALSGSFEDRTKASLAAGCDIILHCNGEMEEMDAIANAAGSFSAEAARRADAALACRHTPDPFDKDWAVSRLKELGAL